MSNHFLLNPSGRSSRRWLVLWKRNLLESLRMAIDSIRDHVFRSVLTLLGIIIGVSTVIAIVSVIEGLDGTIKKSIQNLSPSTFFISRVNFDEMSPDKFQEALRKRPPLTYEDVMAIRRSCPSVKVASPILTRNFISSGTATVKYGNEEASNPLLRGTEPYYQQATNLNVVEGRFLSDADRRHHRNVCVLGSAIADGLFKKVSPIGKKVRIDGIEYEVIGLFEHRETVFDGPSENQLVVIPFETFQKHYPKRDQDFLQIICSAEQPEQVGKAIDETSEILRRRRRVPVDAPDNFVVFTPEQFLTLWHQISDGIFLLMTLIASIALLIGGIGVMNIMWVSVNERIQEIGIRKAIGARRSDILWQFLSEAILLTAAGGVLGILLGIGLGFSMRLFFPTIKTYLSHWSMVAGFGVSVSVGLFFGIWPAYRAGRLDPIEALRYER